MIIVGYLKQLSFMINSCRKIERKKDQFSNIDIIQLYSNEVNRIV